MPTCKHCKKNFPSRLRVSGVLRPHKRKYCLDCLPPDGNKKPLHKRLASADTAENVVCACGRIYRYEKTRGHTKTRCNSCAVNSRRFAVKRRAVAYKGGCCERCGYDRCLNALHFHHRDPSQKLFSPGSNHTRSWALIQAELDKCMLLCSNCHAEVHAEIDLVNNRATRFAQETSHRLTEAKSKILPARCPGCGKRIQRRNKTCADCRSYCSKIVWPSVTKIRRLVIDGSFEAAARRLNVTGNAIRKHLKKHGVVVRKHKPRRSVLSA